MNDGFPHLTDSFLSGQDIFYTQFNSINFYVEDQDQEYFYYNILKKLFPDIDFEKIFPLNGKTTVIEHARNSLGDHSKIYILDLDFDEILERKIEEDNIFYLKRYSIENYLISKETVFEMIREKSPKLKNEEIENLFSLETFIKNCKILLRDLTCTFVVIQKLELGKQYYKINPSRDFNFSVEPPQIRNSFIDDYFQKVEDALKSKDARFSLNAQVKKYRKHFRNDEASLENIPGKYLLSLLKFILESKRIINQVSLESFTYKLSKDADTIKLDFLKTDVESFLNR